MHPDQSLLPVSYTHLDVYKRQPDTAHGTNPASASVVGFDTLVVGSTPEGTVDVEKLKELLNDEIAGIMLTNPNTLGIFEKDIMEIARLMRENGSLLYYDCLLYTSRCV